MAFSRSGFRSSSRRSRARLRSARRTPRLRSVRRTPSRSSPPDPGQLGSRNIYERPAGANASRRPLTIWTSSTEGGNAMAPSPLDDENAPLYTVGQVAEMLAVKQAFLRRVDELRVVSPQRSAGGQRRYTRFEIRVIQQVVMMADEGITLQAIRLIIELEQQLAEVTRQRDELARRLAEDR